MVQEKSDIAVVGTKGQIVIPQHFRKELAIVPNTKVILYRKDDKLVLGKTQHSPTRRTKRAFQRNRPTKQGKK